MQINTSVEDIEISSTTGASVKYEQGKWFITGEVPGQSIITLKSLSNNIEKTYTIQVTPILVSSITFSSIPNLVTVGDSHIFNITVLPNNATNKNTTITYSENLLLENLDELGYKFTANESGEAWIKSVANDGSSIEHIENFVVEPKIIIVDHIELTLPNEIYKSSIINFSESLLISPEDATNKTYTTSIISGPASIVDNEVLSFSDIGIVEIKIKANDSGGYEKAITIDVIDDPTIVLEEE